MIRAEGSDPLRAVDSMMQTAVALRTAPPLHKAQLVAKMIMEFGVPLDALDSALAGEDPEGQQPGQHNNQEFRDPRLDTLLRHIEQSKAQRDQTQQQRAQQDLASFEQTHEFFADVRADMGDLIEMSNRRGIAMSLDDAYSKAVKLHPEISKVLQHRESAKSANATTASTQRARDASSSVRSQPANIGNGVHKGGNTRDDIMAAYAEISGR